jgi:HAD superfamily hydrolase (TIGR01548 family)
MKPLLIFDMDGVLAEVSESYRESIVATVHHFTGTTVTRERIQEYKNHGGYNNDWLLSQQLCRDLGVDVPYETVVDYFCQIFFGENNDGLIAREKWIPNDGLLERLAATRQLAIFTGRNRAEASVTLNRFAASIPFDPVMTTDEVPVGKPAPDGLRMIMQRFPAPGYCYVGDTVDDARSARAAGVPFIGIAALDSPWHVELATVLKAEGAFAVLDDVNQIEGVLPPA